MTRMIPSQRARSDAVIADDARRCLEYHNRHTYSNGVGEWDVPRLWELVTDLPVQEVDPEAFLGERYCWESDLTLRNIAEHMRRVLSADMTCPIILSADGCVMDGNHRLIRGALDGVRVLAVQFAVTPTPDRPARNHP